MSGGVGVATPGVEGQFLLGVGVPNRLSPMADNDVQGVGLTPGVEGSLGGVGV